VLEREPERIDLKVLSQFPEFHAFRTTQTPTSPASAGPGQKDELSAATPEEAMEAAYEQLRSALAEELLSRVKEQTPAFFEQLVLDVLHAMGYGGRRRDGVVRLGGTGDEGIDGVIHEDKLGLDVIYVQAKRWQNPVGRPVIQAFVGALQGARASKGVLITTSTFTSDAQSYADSVSPRVILVDGRELAELMLDHDVGVGQSTRYEIKKIDEDYFADEGDDVGASSPDAVTS
jgi:restriction system protein